MTRRWVRSRTLSTAQADSNVGLQAGLTRDIWTVVDPNLTPLQSEITAGDRAFLKLMTSLTPAQASTPALVELDPLLPGRRRSPGSPRGIVTHPWPVEFLLIVSPLVTWIWLGALIIAIGGLIALWPVPVRARRPATAAHRRAPAGHGGRSTGARARDRVAAVEIVIVLVVLRRHVVRDPARCAARPPAEPAGRAARAGRARGRPARRSTARSATPSSITGPASCPTTTIRRSTARCGLRRSRSCTGSTRAGGGRRRATASGATIAGQ